MIFGDEAGGGTQPRCREDAGAGQPDPDTLGPLWFYDVASLDNMAESTSPTRATPVELGHHNPHGANTWSAYWYDGHVCTNDGEPRSRRDAAVRRGPRGRS